MNKFNLDQVVSFYDREPDGVVFYGKIVEIRFRKNSISYVMENTIEVDENYILYVYEPVLKSRETV